jgi:hypothetical protein
MPGSACPAVPFAPSEPSAVTTLTERAVRRASSAEDVGLVVGCEQDRDGAAALAQALGQREQRCGGVALPDEDAVDRLLRLGERASERTGEVDLRALDQTPEPGRADSGGLDDHLEGDAMTSRRPDPVDPEAAAGQVGSVGQRDRDEVARPEALGNAGRCERQVPERAHLLGGQHLGRHVERAGPLTDRHSSHRRRDTARRILRGHSGPS